MKPQISCLMTFVLVFLVSIGTNAQVTTATILGSVTDENKDGLIGASVVALHQPSGTQYGTTTRDDGGYTLPNLRVGGPYTVSISYVGHESYEAEEIYLKLGQKMTIAATLASSSSTLDEVVIVGDRSAIFSNERTGAETNITNETIQTLPSISRSASDFTRLTPASDGNSFGGRNDQFNNFSLDGSIFNNPFGLDAATPGGQAAAQPVSLDAIDQIVVSLAPYDVTQAGFTGAAVNAVTKSGTNEFHGTVFGFFRNDDMTGSKVDGDEIIVPDLTQSQYGFSLGGPIIKNKLFFFANAEIDNREDLGTTFVADDGTNSGENVSSVLASDLQRVSDALRDNYGYETGAYQGYIHNTNSTKGLVKLDWAINNSHTLTATYNFLDAFKEKPAHPSAIGPRGPNATTLQFENSGYRINNVIHSGILELRSIFGNKYANKLQLGYTSFIDSRDPFSEPFPVVSIQKDGFRYIIAGHEPFSIHNRLDQNVLQFTNNLNIYMGDHTITAGVSFEKFDFDNSFNLNAYDGTFGDWASVDELLAAIADSSFHAVVEAARATFERNGGDDGEEGVDQDPNTDGFQGWALAETNVGQGALYIQDEWQVNNKLNVTLGLRADMPFYFDTKDKIEENLIRNGANDPTIVWYDEDGNEVTYNHTDLPESNILISPRLGFNYDVHGDQSTQLRGGTGLFSGRFPFVWLGNQVANPNWFFYNTTASDFKFLQVWRTNLGMDKKFGKGWVGTLDLIYTKDINAPIVRNAGLKTPSATLAGVDNRPVYGPDDHAVFNGLGFPLPVNGYVFGNTDIGQSFNASLQVRKSFANDFDIMVGYNYLWAEDASSIEAEISSDAYDRNPAFGNVNKAVAAPSLYGAKHRIIGSAAKTWKYGSWATTVSTFFSIQEGGTTDNDNLADFRYSYTYSGDINGDGSVLNDLIYIPTDSELDDMNFVNDAQREAYRAYIEQDDYLSEHRGEYMEKYGALAPWFSNWDVRILQDYHIGNETGNRIQFSLDIVNFGNLLNSAWNVKQLPANTQPVSVSFENDEPVYSFAEGLTETYVNDFSLLSRWQARVGLRYIF